MSIGLTPDEVEYARKRLAGLEKNGRSWKRARWALLVVCVAKVGVAVACWITFAHISAINRSAILGGRSVAQLQDFADRKAQLTFMECSTAALAMFLTLTSALLLAMCIVNWRRHHFSSIVSKLVREKLEEIETNTVGRRDGKSLSSDD